MSETREPNYEAAFKAFCERTAYWAPEQLHDPECFAVLLDDLLVAAGRTEFARLKEECERGNRLAEEVRWLHAKYPEERERYWAALERGA